MASPAATGKRPRSVVENGVEAVKKVNGKEEADELEEKAPAPNSESVAEDEESEEEEMLVVLELCDFKNHPLFDDYSSATLEGIDTAKPMLKIGEYELHGQLEETVGTSYFYDTDTSKSPDKTYQFAGQTVKKIKFTIAPPEDLNMAADRFNINRQWEHLQAKYVGTGHADTTKFEWAVNQHRDTLASHLGHSDMMAYFAVAENESMGRVRYNMLEKMLQPCGPPPQKEEE
ncbi:Splicing factor 3B subunit 5 [Phytophthora citrophthora]|uniref:Splicing factor 3B subunit 5 n=2 Tax=Peronosporaceae TaxID=4777 RepID=A0AAD9GSK9_9STRA|nr:Splicing factor 3B subunit 5 [Phytophthora citrophthora]